MDIATTRLTESVKRRERKNVWCNNSSSNFHKCILQFSDKILFSCHTQKSCLKDSAVNSIDSVIIQSPDRTNLLPEIYDLKINQDLFFHIAKNFSEIRFSMWAEKHKISCSFLYVSVKIWWETVRVKLKLRLISPCKFQMFSQWGDKCAARHAKCWDPGNQDPFFFY